MFITIPLLLLMNTTCLHLFTNFYIICILNSVTNQHSVVYKVSNIEDLPDIIFAQPEITTKIRMFLLMPTHSRHLEKDLDNLEHKKNVTL